VQNVRTGRIDGRGPGQRQRDTQFIAHDLDGLGHARLARGGQCIQKRSADQCPAGTQGEGLRNILPGADAAVEEDLATALYGIDDLAQHRNRGRCPIELPAAVI